jgi:hypothetical protein
MYDEFLKARYKEAVESPPRRMDLVEIIGSLQWIYQQPKSLKAETIGHEALAQGAEVLMRLANESLPGFYKVDVFREEWDRWSEHKREDRKKRIVTNAKEYIEATKEMSEPGDVVTGPVTEAPPFTWKHKLHRFIGRILRVGV